ncbi:unnamed protein product [Spirodela intermedia]|uniref:Tf2-1-like SH3-like domain-containing protein n=1 Tax=Spirodela intermedia TaxID=51605 RepID=A0A7I8LDG3_SPIIN|nr:unnamed protein product [Spirodela intermedia]
MKRQADQRCDVEFQVGDRIFLRLQPCRQHSVACRPYEKLSPKFYGPFRTQEEIGLVAYQLEHLATAQIHLVFHVLQVKQAVNSSEPNGPFHIQKSSCKSLLSPLPPIRAIFPYFLQFP